MAHRPGTAAADIAQTGQSPPDGALARCDTGLLGQVVNQQGHTPTGPRNAAGFGTRLHGKGEGLLPGERAPVEVLRPSGPASLPEGGAPAGAVELQGALHRVGG